jgi:hypothetical protein
MQDKLTMKTYVYIYYRVASYQDFVFFHTCSFEVEAIFLWVIEKVPLLKEGEATRDGVSVGAFASDDSAGIIGILLVLFSSLLLKPTLQFQTHLHEESNKDYTSVLI